MNGRYVHIHSLTTYYRDMTGESEGIGFPSVESPLMGCRVKHLFTRSTSTSLLLVTLQRQETSWVKAGPIGKEIVLQPAPENDDEGNAVRYCLPREVLHLRE